MPRGRIRRVRIEARAKLNLGLAVGPARADGFHEIGTFYQSISLRDTLTVERRPRGYTLAVRFADASLRRGAPSGPSPSVAAVPSGPANLVLRAAKLLADRHGLAGGAHFTLIKRIPAGAGLGGGSADAAAALVGLARLHRLRLRAVALRALGGELGADVPFALLGGTALGMGRGEQLRPIRLARPFRAVLAVPAWRVSTASAFRRLDRRKYGLTRWAAKLRFVQSLGREAVRVEDALRLGNSFEGVLNERRSEFLSLCARLRRAGAQGPHLTGSGSAVFGIVPAGTAASTIAERFTGAEALYLIASRRRGVTRGAQP